MRITITVGLLFFVLSTFGQNPIQVDRDNDGFISKYFGGSDYNDLDESIHPGVAWLGINQDINHNGMIDEEEALAFEDGNRNALADVHDLLFLLDTNSESGLFENKHLIDQLLAYYNHSCLGF